MAHAILPLGRGTVLDPFAGSGSTLAAAFDCSLETVEGRWQAHYAFAQP